MRKRLSLPILAGLAFSAPAGGELVAERLNVDNAATHLFGGTDADGGVDDWYLSNGVIEAIVDDVGLQADLPAGVEPPPKQSEAAPTGGSLIDLALVGHDNDQLNQLFTVGGLSTDNFIAYDEIRAETTATHCPVHGHRGGTLAGQPGRRRISIGHAGYRAAPGLRLFLPDTGPAQAGKRA